MKSDKKSGNKSQAKNARKNAGKNGKKHRRRALAAESVQAQPSKPTYLGLLNAIAVGEARADQVLRIWRDTTDDADLARVLDVVAIREREHAAAFAKRLCELGFSVRESESETHDANIRLAGSNASDCEKFAALLGIDDSGVNDDPFDKLFADTTIDPATGALLGRYIAEERDSGRRLRAAYEAINQPVDPVLGDIANRLDRLTRTLEELKALRS